MNANNPKSFENKLILNRSSRQLGVLGTCSVALEDKQHGEVHECTWVSQTRTFLFSGLPSHLSSPSFLSALSSTGSKISKFNHNFGGDVTVDETAVIVATILNILESIQILYSRIPTTNTSTMCQMILTAVALVRVRRVTVITPVTTRLPSRTMRRPMITRRWNTITSWRKTQCLSKRWVIIIFWHQQYPVGGQGEVNILWGPQRG